MQDPLELCPRPGGAPPARIWSAPDKPVSVVLLGAVLGHWLHWSRKRTIPCATVNCNLCKRKVPARWQGYAPGCERVTKLTNSGHVAQWQRIVIPIAPELDESISVAGALPLILHCVPRKAARGFEVKKIEALLKTDGLPESFDVRLVLYRVFGIRPPSAENQKPRNGEPDNDQQHA